MNGASKLDSFVSQPFSRKNCMIIINGITINANCIIAIIAVSIPCRIISPHPTGAASVADIKPYCASSAPPLHNKFITNAANIARNTRTPTIIHHRTPTLEATADSINRLCEKESIIAIMNTSFTLKSKETIAAIPAYKFKVLPRTSGTAASPDRPIKPMIGSNCSIIQGNTGVNCNIVTINVIGKITFPNVQVVVKPCKKPRFNIPFIRYPTLQINSLLFSLILLPCFVPIL